jgi:hypothetical protein
MALCGRKRNTEPQHLVCWGQICPRYSFEILCTPTVTRSLITPSPRPVGERLVDFEGRWGQPAQKGRKRGRHRPQGPLEPFQVAQPGA